MKRVKLNFVITAACLSFSSFGHAEAPSWSGKPFTAVQLEFNEALPKKVAKSRVYMAKAGIRVEGISNPDSPMPKIISVYRFKDDKNMIIDLKRKAYVVIEENPNMQVDEELGGILSRKPCDGFEKSKKTGTETYEKRKVEKWACLHPTDGVVVYQFFDPKMQLVLKENIEGQVIELRNIKAKTPKKSLFEVPKGYKKMSMAEMMTGYVELNPYQGGK